MIKWVSTAAAAAMLAGVFLMGIGTRAYGQKVKAEDFDLNGDKRIDRKEFDALSRHRGSEEFRIADKNHDGVIDADERKTADSSLQGAVVGEGQRFEELTKSPDGTLSIDQVNRRILGRRPPFDAFGLQLRRKMEDTSYASSASGEDDSEGALLSYQRDFNSDSDVWTFRGILYRPFEPIKKPVLDDSTTLRYWTLTPSIAVDRVTNSVKRDKETNLVVARLTTEIAFRDGLPWDGQIVRASGLFASDVDGETSIPGVEVEWEPLWLRTGIGAYHNIFGIVRARWRPMAHVEYTSVVNNGGRASLPEQDLVRVGPKLTLELRPPLHILQDRLKGTLSYIHLNEVIEGDAQDLFEASVSYDLDDSGVFSVVVNYRTGQIPLVEEETNTLTVGVGIKF
jgi:hypothetical protein